jgi:hypothetical protein
VTAAVDGARGSGHRCPVSSEEVRRASDGELLGWVRPAPDGGWEALVVFGGVLGERPTEAEARRLVEREGLAALARHWYLRRRGTDAWRIVVIQEARPGRVRGVLGWYALPGAETFVLSRADLAAGDELRLEPPDDVVDPWGGG